MNKKHISGNCAVKVCCAVCYSPPPARALSRLPRHGQLSPRWISASALRLRLFTSILGLRVPGESSLDEQCHNSAEYRVLEVVEGGREKKEKKVGAFCKCLRNDEATVTKRRRGAHGCVW